MRSGITWIISPNPSLAFTCPIYHVTNLHLTNPTPHQLPCWIYYMSAQSTKIRHAELHLSLWNTNIFRALLALLSPTVTHVPSHCGQALMSWPLLFTYNTELLNKMKNLRRHRKYIKDPSNSTTFVFFFNYQICLAGGILEDDLFFFFLPIISQVNISNSHLTFSLHIHKAHKKVIPYNKKQIHCSCSNIASLLTGLPQIHRWSLKFTLCTSVPDSQQQKH